MHDVWCCLYKVLKFVMQKNMLLFGLEYLLRKQE